MALEILLTGDPVDAQRALQVGLVNRVVPAGDLRARVGELAGRIAGMLRLEPVPVRGGEPRAFAQVVRHQFVLRGEVAIERHLVGAGRLCNGVHPHGADPIPIEQLARDREDARSGGNFLEFFGTYVS